MITNNFSHPVIQLDDRNADTSWTNHTKRGSLGGVDLAYPYGTPVYASMKGLLTLFEWNGTGGHTARITTGNTSIEYMHLSKFHGVNRFVAVGDLIGYSGASGSRNLWFYSPHLHVHAIVNGVRVNVFNLFTVIASKKKFILTSKVEDMRIIGSTNKSLYFIGPKGMVWIKTMQHAELLTRVITNKRTTFNPAEIDILKLYV